MNSTRKTYRIEGTAFEQDELLALCQEKLTTSTLLPWEKEIWAFLIEWFSPVDFVEVSTSGSTGSPRDIQLRKEHMKASARATINFLGLDPADVALLCLPVKYIAGKMMVVRALEGGLDLRFTEPASCPELGRFVNVGFCAMVPLQLKCLLDTYGTEHLNKIKKLILGGGFLQPGMKEQVSQMKNQVWQTYGMTETITHIAMRRLNGPFGSEFYTPLPGVKVEADERNCLVITNENLGVVNLRTNDLVELKDDLSFKILGRIDNIINSGGVKLFPEILENKLEGLTANEFFLAGKADDTLGESLVLVIENDKTLDSNVFYLWKEIEQRLDGFEVPKEIIYLEHFIRTGNGKVNRTATLEKAVGWVMKNEE